MRGLLGCGLPTGLGEAAVLAEEPTTKQTYAIRNSLAELFVRISYWQRQPRT